MKTVYNNLLTTILTVLFICGGGALLAQDQHIDPSEFKHKHSLTFAQHVDAAGFTTADAVSGMNYATGLLQRCDAVTTADQDVATMVTLEASGALGTFGTAGDGLDIINTSAELNAVLADNSAFIKVVTDIVDVPGTLGVADTPGSSIVIINSMGLVTLGETLVHEFGHSRGLPHRNSPGNPIMHEFEVGINEVNQAEAAAYHNGGVEDGKNRPVDFLFLIDDTGSMGQEIAGVRNAILLFLTFLDLFGGSDCGTVYQLVTFKDNYTIRDPTTDLNVIRTQVEGLRASGGGDCPEASAEALMAAMENVKDEGVIFLATDAAPHPGTDIEGTAAALAERGVIVSTLLSGDCSSSSFIASRDGGLDAAYFSDNGGGETPAEEDVRTEVAGDRSSHALTAIEAFSLLARVTGGTFAFVPEVNSGDPLARQRYENIGYNLLVGALTVSVTLVEPSEAPQGGVLNLNVTGSKTNFNESTTAAFSDPDIAVSGVTVLGPTSAIVSVSVAPGTALGLKDIVMTTSLSTGDVEEAQGIGLFEVTSPPGAPTILSISPNAGTAGQELTVVVNGINTNFDATSVLDLEEGIRVLETRVNSPVELEADIQIAVSASAGFRDVTVVTGAEFAREFVPGPFLVTLSGCDVSGLEVVSSMPTVYYGYADSACAVLSVAGIPDEELENYSFEWSTGETTPSINVCPDATAFYSVTATSGGCVFEGDVQVCVVDVSCGNNDDKVEVCHRTGKPGKYNALCIAAESVAEHLAHGDILGDCMEAGCDDVASLVLAESAGSGSMRVEKVYPNPFTRNVTISIAVEQAAGLAFKVYDQFGYVVQEGKVNVAEGTNEIEVNLGGSSSGVYYLRFDDDHMKPVRIFKY